MNKITHTHTLKLWNFFLKIIQGLILTHKFEETFKFTGDQVKKIYILKFLASCFPIDQKKNS